MDKDIMEGKYKDNPVTQELIKNIDVLVDGEFQIEKKDKTLKFRGSQNQRIIDVKKTLESGKIVKYME